MANVGDITDKYGDLRSRHLQLTGFCSPEGAFVYNQHLAFNRAEGLKRFIMHRYGLTDGQITVKAVGEDWRALRHLLVVSNYAWRDEAINIIDKIYDKDTREILLKQLNGGEPYKRMLELWFPQLRRVNVQVR